MQSVFEQKLQILNCPFRNNLQIDENNIDFRKTLVWLENKKIKSNSVPELFKKVESDKWLDGYVKYKNSVNCPMFDNDSSLLEEFYWFLSKAIQNEYSINKVKYENVAKNKAINVPKVTSENRFDTLDFQSLEFKNGVESLAKILNIYLHSDHLMTLKACSEFIAQRLNAQALKNIKTLANKQTEKVKTFTIDEIKIGFDLEKDNLNRAAKCLCLLYIKNLRELQTEINEILVSIQNITADPKTDSKLGKVGR